MIVSFGISSPEILDSVVQELKLKNTNNDYDVSDEEEESPAPLKLSGEREFFVHFTSPHITHIIQIGDDGRMNGKCQERVRSMLSRCQHFHSK